MNYKEAFAIDEIFFKDLTDIDKDEKHKFQLYNFNYYEPKLVDDFYLKYFIRELLFQTDILELKDFLEYHYDYCDNPEKYYNILDFKVIPKIQEIIDNAEILLNGRQYYDEKPLEDGFVETDGIIKNFDYDYPSMISRTARGCLQNEFKKRIEIVKVFVEAYKNDTVVKPLKWTAGPGTLGYIIRELVDLGYIEADMYKGDVNSSDLARKLLEVFNLNEHSSPDSLSKFLNPNSKKYISIKKKFDDKKFSIPSYKFL
jgi:hypothetical protein